MSLVISAAPPGDSKQCWANIADFNDPALNQAQLFAFGDESFLFMFIIKALFEMFDVIPQYNIKQDWFCFQQGMNCVKCGKHEKHFPCHCLDI